ncbi:MAG: MFS transporter [Candidatus Margulisiibacteriota bacterium]
MANTNLIQLLSYAALMASSIFIPLLAESFGAGPGTVGLIVGAYNGLFLCSSYLFGVLADKYGGRLILRAGLLFCAAVFAAQVLAHDIVSLFYLRALAGAGAGVFPAALAVYAYSEQRGKMGKFQGFGSLGWALGSIVAGLLAATSVIFALSAVCFAAAFCASLQLESEYPPPRPVKLVPWRLFWRNSRVYVPYFFRALGAQSIWAVFPLYLVMTGADKLWVGIAYFVNTFSQFLIMGRIERFHNLFLVNIGLLCTVMTFAGYALFPYLPVVLFLQVLLALSFSTLQVGSLQELMTRNQAEQSVAVGLLNSIINFTAVVGPFLAGWITQDFGFASLMWAGAGLAFLGLVTFTSVLE